MDGFKSNLNKYHDELADLKSYFDGHRDDDAFDPKKLFCSYLRIYIIYLNTCTLSKKYIKHMYAHTHTWPRKVSSLRKVVQSIETEPWPRPSHFCSQFFLLIYL